MFTVMLQPVAFWQQLTSMWAKWYDNLYNEPCHKTANYRVTRTVVEKGIYYSDATTPEKAVEEALCASNLLGNRWHRAQVSATHAVVACKLDSDGYDTVTGIRAEKF
jgi:hypothetical protein